MSDRVDRDALRRVIAVANGKGGVGKTSLSTHLASMAAASGQHVLLVDLDPQGNAGQDLGYTAAGLSDDGVGLARAVQYGDTPYVIKDVRENLDVIPAGDALDDLSGALDARAEREGQDVAALSLARALTPIAGDHALTILDCPPRHAVLQKAALACAAYLLIPTKTDSSSRLGLAEMARRFAAALAVNPDLRLLGVVLFGVTPAAKKIRLAAREWINEALSNEAPVFDATIRHVEGPAYHIRERGQLAHELELAAVAGVTAAMAKTAVGLASDYQAVSVETLTRLLKMEAERA